MLWACIKVPHCGLPRASARREAAYPSRILQHAYALEAGTGP
jgi:hypothetical protein